MIDIKRVVSDKTDFGKDKKMSLTAIDAKTMQKAFISGANCISNQKEYINELNVFPVPDGDTGTNMTLTIMAAAAEVGAIKEPTIDSVAKAISGGSLRGARGNSGVILSQLFRGFCKDVKGKETICIQDLASGFERAVETAYKAVMKPKEGTILTVARGMSEKAVEIIEIEDDIIDYLQQIIEYGDEVLARTPEMLPVLKEAGVVDSGGQGLMEVMRGVLLGLKGEDVQLENPGENVKTARGAGLLEDIPKARPVYNMGSGKDDISTADIKYTYCTEFIVLLEKELSDDEVEGIKQFLLSIGDSLVCVADEELVKIHVHTNHPGQAFEKGLEYGQLTRCKIDNMREEHSERVEIEQQRAAEQEAAFKEIKLEMAGRKSAAGSADGPVDGTVAESQADTDSVEDTTDKKTPPVFTEPPKKYGIISVSTGEGLSEILTEIGVDYIISGGQTMNPSTDDILSAVDFVNAENIFVLPNNKNIILAANQAASICENKKLYVVPSTSIPQGIGAVIAFNPDVSPEENIEGMKEAMGEVKTGEITFAVRDTSIDGVEIRKNNIMGISDNGIDAVGAEIDQVTKDLIEKLVDEDSGLISIYYGEDISEEDANKLGEYLEEKYEDLDIDVKYGGQPIYYYLLSVE